jgi:hypothetical protein
MTRSAAKSAAALARWADPAIAARYRAFHAGRRIPNTPEIEAEIRRMDAAGATRSEMYSRLGITWRPLYRMLRELGLLRKRGTQQAAPEVGP